MKRSRLSNYRSWVERHAARSGRGIKRLSAFQEVRIWLLYIDWEETCHERYYPCRGLRDEALSVDPNGQQASDAGLRQADDLLPAVRPDAGRDPGYLGDFHSRVPAPVLPLVERWQPMGDALFLCRPTQARGTGAGVRHWPRVCG